jgi:hypothetical protein
MFSLVVYFICHCSSYIKMTKYLKFIIGFETNVVLKLEIVITSSILNQMKHAILFYYRPYWTIFPSPHQTPNLNMIAPPIHIWMCGIIMGAWKYLGQFVSTFHMVITFSHYIYFGNASSSHCSLLQDLYNKLKFIWVKGY